MNPILYLLVYISYIYSFFGSHWHVALDPWQLGKLLEGSQNIKAQLLSWMDLWRIYQSIGWVCLQTKKHNWRVPFYS